MFEMFLWALAAALAVAALAGWAFAFDWKREGDGYREIADTNYRACRAAEDARSAAIKEAAAEKEARLTAERLLQLETAARQKAERDLADADKATAANRELARAAEVAVAEWKRRAQKAADALAGK